MYPLLLLSVTLLGVFSLRSGVRLPLVIIIIIIYHLVWCGVVKDLIDSPHLSEDCAKGQNVAQYIHPGV